MPRVHLLATGGTIASTAGGAGRVAQVQAEELVQAVSGLPGDLDVAPHDLTTRGSYAFDTTDLLSIAREVHRCLDDSSDGVVITHGTDVMEETAFLLDLVHDSGKPVVLTGAQRPFDDPAPDGPANLGDAIRLVASGAAAGHGVLLGFDGYAYPARGVTKMDTLSTHAFDAPGRGPSVRTAERIEVLSRPPRPQPLPLDLGQDSLPRVDVVAAYLGADGTQVRASVAAGARGLVVAAFGAGNVGPALRDALAEAVAGGIPVVVTSRVLAGAVHPLYAGSGAALGEAGATFGSDLSPWQARLLLAVACSVEPDDPTAVVRRWLAS